MANSDDFLIDDVFPHPDVHLFCGPSGSGKTTILVQMLSTWSRGEKWFGHASYPRPFVYISGERTKRNVERTLTRLGVKKGSFELIGSTDLPKGTSFTSAVNTALLRKPDAKLVVVEGMVRFVPGGKVNDPHIVLNFLVDVQRLCESKGISFILVTWSAKEREGDRILNPREKAMGSVAFGGCSETIVYIEPYKEADVRSVAILKKNARDEFYYMKFDQANGGALTQIASPAETATDISQYILSFDHGFQFSPEDISDAFPDVSEKAVRVRINKLLDQRELSRVHKGKYRRIKTGGPGQGGEIEGLPGVLQGILPADD